MVAEKAPCQVCYLQAPGKLVLNDQNDYVCPNLACSSLIATHYTDHTCSSCTQFVQVARGHVIARLELVSVKPVVGGTRSRGGIPLATDDSGRGSRQKKPRQQMPLLRDITASGYKSVVSSKKVGPPSAVLSDFNMTGGFSRHEDGVRPHDEEMGKQAMASHENSVLLQ